MDFLKSFQFWFGAINLIGTGLLFAFNYFSHQKIVGNDLHHLSADVKEISNLQKEQGTKLGKLAEDVSYLKGKTEIRMKSYAKKKLKV